MNVRKSYMKETKLKPLNYSDHDWYTREYQMWMENKLQEFFESMKRFNGHYIENDQFVKETSRIICEHAHTPKNV